MSLKIKIKSNAVQPESIRPSKHSKRRIDSDDDDFRHGSADEGTSQPLKKRAKKASSYGRASPREEFDEDAIGEVDIEGDAEDTRFLPPAPSVPASPVQKPKASNKKVSSHRTKAESKASSSSKPSGKRSRRSTVVWTDDEDDEFPEREPDLDDSDEEFTPETAPKRTAVAPKTKSGKPAPSAKGAKGKAKKEENVIFTRDERKLPPAETSASSSSKRPRPKSDDARTPTPPPSVSATDVRDNDDAEPVAREDSIPPVSKKRKLPPIKKNKPPNASSETSAKPPKPGQTAAGAKAAFGTPTGLPLPVSSAAAVRKPAATLNNADVDLRDANVYASLFTKPGGSTPNSGLNRKEKEEERRKELNRMRDEARVKRAEEAKHAFDLQAPQEKIQRFEEILHSRGSIARYPNILGAAFKTLYERNKTKQEEGELR